MQPPSQRKILPRGLSAVGDCAAFPGPLSLAMELQPWAHTPCDPGASLPLTDRRAEL